MWIQLAIIGLIVAMLPLGLVWVADDTDKYRKLVWVTLFLTFDLIMFGAFTRLTDSGLGCPDWPGCYGEANPLQAHANIKAAESLMPTGPVTLMKAWVEMTHRYLAMAVGVLIMVLMVLAWRSWLKSPSLRSGRTKGEFSPWLPTALFFLVCLQGAFGAWTVALKLQPLIVTIHLVLGLSLLALLTWLTARQSEHVAVADGAVQLRVPAAIALVLLGIQIALGGWVSTNYAPLACLDFPLCQGAWLPEMDFAHGFSIWRDLGKTVSGEYLPYPALTAIHWVHRSFALIVIFSSAWLAHKGLRMVGLEKTSRWILIGLALQFVTGVSTIFLKWPLLLALAHNGGAALLLLLLVMLNCKIRLPFISRIPGSDSQTYKCAK